MSRYYYYYHRPSFFNGKVFRFTGREKINRLFLRPYCEDISQDGSLLGFFFFLFFVCFGTTDIRGRLYTIWRLGSGYTTDWVFCYGRGAFLRVGKHSGPKKKASWVGFFGRNKQGRSRYTEIPLSILSSTAFSKHFIGGILILSSIKSLFLSTSLPVEFSVQSHISPSALLRANPSVFCVWVTPF